MAIRLPRVLLAEMGLVDSETVELAVVDGRLVITPVTPRYELEELVKGITPDNRHTETDWGAPQGSESW